MNEDIICWWSGGVTSAEACDLAIKKFGIDRCRVVMLDTMNEDIDTYRFKVDCEKRYGKPIELWRSQKYKCIQDVWYEHKSLNTANGAICSYMLKRKVREDWEKQNPNSWTHQVFGFEYDKKEINRSKSMMLNHSQTKPIFPLIDNKITKDQCALIIENDWGVRIPNAYYQGYRNNNCLNTGCVQGGIGYWQKRRIDNPESFDAMAKVEHDLTNMRGHPVTMLKDQSNYGKRKTEMYGKYANLVFLKPHPFYPLHKSLSDMKGRKVEPLVDCNGFCGVDDLIPNKEQPIQYELAYMD